MAQYAVLPEVPPQLKRKIPTPRCDLAKGRADYATEEVDASRTCWRAGFLNAQRRVNALVAAVEAREKAARELSAQNQDF